MTITYGLDVSSVSLINFFRLLFRWRGSIWKNVWKELVIWLCGYYIIFFIYRFALNNSQQHSFEKIAGNYDKSLSYIPLTFMLGFFVTIVIDRWRQVFSNMGFIENVALTIGIFVRGTDPEARLVRRTMIRYIVLSQVLVFRNISMQVRRRFPTIESIINQGFLHENERISLDDINIPYNKYWAPMQWAINLCYQLGERDKTQPTLYTQVITEIKLYRTSLSALVNYDWVPIPITYPQVVFLAVRSYFVICMLSRQFIINKDATNASKVDLWFPLMSVMQFVFIVGWSKVAEQLLNPLGEDDDDFECNFLIDKNLETGLAIVDECYDSCPPTQPDIFENPKNLEARRKMDGSMDFFNGSAAGVELEEVPDSEPKTWMDRIRQKLRILQKPTKAVPDVSFCGDDMALARSRSATRTSRANSYVTPTIVIDKPIE